jgi:hypothetical protein
MSDAELCNAIAGLDREADQAEHRNAYQHSLRLRQESFYLRQVIMERESTDGKLRATRQ